MANLALRFALEVTALIGFGLAAWDVASGPWRWLLVVGVPLLAATIWGTFAVPAGVLAALLVLHYAISRDRIVWLLGR